MFRLFLLCSITILFSFCTDNNTDQGNTTANASATSGDITNSAAMVPVKKHYEASHEAPYCKLWVVEISTDPENQEAYKGRWFDLKTDGTFETGQYADQTNTGNWSIVKDTEIIKLKFDQTSVIPPNWKIQGAGGGGRILWKGNVDKNPRGHQVILEEATAKPVAN